MPRMTSSACHDADVPVFPVPRAAHCPLEPPAEFAKWREGPGPRRAMWQGQLTWVISRYEDIRSALVDPRLSADIIPDFLRPSSAVDQPVIFSRTDDPEHQRLRRMMIGSFTAKRVEQMRPRIQQLVDHYLSKMIKQGPSADFVRDFALPVPSLVIAELLGVPSEDLEMFQSKTSIGLDNTKSDEERAQAIGEMYVYLQGLVDDKGRDPGCDLISRLASDYVSAGEVDRQTAAMSGVIMIAAGHETTANMIALGLIALLERRDVFQRLGRTDDPAVIANAVEELIRYLSIVHQVARRAIEDLTVGGQLIHAGEIVLMNLPAGNWDSDLGDGPETFDVDRNARGHLGFGYGAHQCIGANLARVEMQVAFATLTRRLPDLKLAVAPEALRFKDSEIYGVRELPVIW